MQEPNTKDVVRVASTSISCDDHDLSNDVDATTTRQSYSSCPNSSLGSSRTVRLQPLNLLWEGSFSSVILCKVNDEMGNVIVKVIDKLEEFSYQSNEDFEEEPKSIELEVLERMQDHPFIVKLHFAYESETRRFLGLEHCRLGDLFDLSNRQRISFRSIKLFLAEIFLAMKALHERNIVHRDIKLENVGIAIDGHVRLLDFGTCHIFNGSSDRVITSSGTLLCSPPENLLREPARFEPDFWALGIMFYELLSDEQPFLSDDEAQITKNICCKELEIPFLDQIDYFTEDLLRGLLMKRTTERYNQADVETHEYFTRSFSWDAIINKELSPMQALHEDACHIRTGILDLEISEEKVEDNIETNDEALRTLFEFSRDSLLLSLLQQGETLI